MTLRSLPLLFAIAAIGFACTKPVEKRPEWKDVFLKINEEALIRGRGYEALGTATKTIGHRLTGSENGSKAEEFAWNFFKEAGLDSIRFEPFEMQAWSRDTVSLEILGSKTNGGIPAVALANTPVFSDTTAAVIWVGSGLAKDFENAASMVPGKIVLMTLQLAPGDSNMKNLHRSEKAALAMKYKASGIIFINNIDGNIRLTGTASTTGQLITIPAVCISKEDGMSLYEKNILSLSGKGGYQTRARIFMRNRSGMIKARNVIARIEGSELPDEKIIIGGHLDSWDLATGAIDNGIGSFTIMEIARIFQALNLRPRRTIEFVMFMGEEQGLLGSRSMIENLQASGEINRIRYMMNLDMAGNATGFGVNGRNEMKSWVDSTGSMIRLIDTVFHNKVDSGAGLHSDHQSFMLEGIPIMGVVSNLDRSIYKCYHADCDNFDLVNRDHMVNCARFTAMFLYALADAENIPVNRLKEDEIREFLEKHHLREELEVAGNWRWK